jgi:hypothetical protein
LEAVNVNGNGQMFVPFLVDGFAAGRTINPLAAAGGESKTAARQRETVST